MAEFEDIGTPKNIGRILVEDDQICLGILYEAGKPMSLRGIYREMVRQAIFLAKKNGADVHPSIYEKVASNSYQVMKDREIVKLAKDLKKTKQFAIPSYEKIKSIIERLSGFRVKVNWKEIVKETSTRDGMFGGRSDSALREPTSAELKGFVFSRSFGTGKTDTVYYANPNLFDLPGVSLQIFPSYTSPKSVVEAKAVADANKQGSAASAPTKKV